MANFSLRRYDTQARVSVIISAAAAVMLVGLVFLILRHFDSSQFIVAYGSKRRMAVLGAGATIMLLSAIGFGMGFNSAGQRRNDQQKLSWIGFFLAAGVFCLTAVLLAFFQLRGEQAIGG